MVYMHTILIHMVRRIKPLAGGADLNQKILTAETVNVTLPVTKSAKLHEP